MTDFCDLAHADVRVFWPNADHPTAPAVPPHMQAAYWDASTGMFFIANNQMKWVCLSPLPQKLAFEYTLAQGQQQRVIRLRLVAGGHLHIRGRIRIGG